MPFGISIGTRCIVRAALAFLLLTVVTHGFGMHHHAGGEHRPGSCALCTAAATPAAPVSAALALPKIAPCPPTVAVYRPVPFETHATLPPGRGPPA